MRKSYVYDEKRGELVPKEEYYASKADRGPIVFGDMPDVLSPIDGKIINGRSGMREHNRRHGVTFTEDFREQWKKQEKDRQRFFEGRSDKKQRAEAVAQAFERVKHGYNPHKEKYNG